jgi:uncharacterized protein (DUF952 family)
VSSNIFHIAERRDWDAAQTKGGPYEVSTRGQNLADVGFIHASRDEDQARTVQQAFYGDLDDLVLLTIDTTNLDVRHEPVGDDVFPHIYGPIPLTAVIDVRPLPRTR